MIYKPHRMGKKLAEKVQQVVGDLDVYCGSMEGPAAKVSGYDAATGQLIASPQLLEALDLAPGIAVKGRLGTYILITNKRTKKQ